MDIMTTRQVADKLGVHRSRVHALIQAERLPAQKFGNVYIISESDLKLVENRKPGRPSKDRAETTSAPDGKVIIKKASKKKTTR